MSRYLTPTKVGLLALVSLYTESVVPSTATIPILSFLISHLLPLSPNSSHSAPATSAHRLDASVDSLQQATIGHVSGIPGRTVWDLLLNKLWEVTSFDAFHIFFDDLSLLLERPRDEQDIEDLEESKASQIRLSRTSPLGAFVRRSQLEFTRLQFHDDVALWKSFVMYRHSTLAQWRRRHPGVGDNIDTNLPGAAGEHNELVRDAVYGEVISRGSGKSSVSTEDVEKLLEYQVDQMQSMSIRPVRTNLSLHS